LNMNKRGGDWSWQLLAQALRLAIAGALLSVAACGGGGDGGTQAGVGSGGTGSYSSGNISAFGSIVVNGTHYDHEAVGVSITAVNPDGTSRVLRASDLKLGMTIEVDEAPATKVNGVTQAGALTMRVRSELIGPVTELNQAAGTFKVLGQVVHVRPGTGSDNAGGTRYEDEFGTIYSQPFSDVRNGAVMLHNGDVVEVYGYQNAAQNLGEYIATRVERKALAAAAGTVNQYVLRGVVKELDVNAGTCTIGSAHIGYVDTAKLAGLANGRVVRVSLPATAAIGSVLMGDEVKPTEVLQPDRPNATLVGLVTRITNSGAFQFEVNGVPVDASPGHCSGCTSSNFPQLGARLRVQGDLVGGTLQANRVTAISELP
jgi:Domain of unknown function (DUF5666)